jgi:hypothetical protein
MPKLIKGVKDSRVQVEKQESEFRMKKYSSSPYPSPLGGED